MCTCPLGRSRRPFACSSDARHAHGVFNNRYSYTSSYASARGQSDCQKTTRNGLLKPPILGVSGATNTTCCAHARPCGSISISSIHVSLHIAAINCPIGRATWHATWHAPTWQISARVVSTDTILADTAVTWECAEALAVSACPLAGIFTTPKPHGCKHKTNILSMPNPHGRAKHALPPSCAQRDCMNASGMLTYQAIVKEKSAQLGGSADCAGWKL